MIIIFPDHCQSWTDFQHKREVEYDTTFSLTTKFSSTTQNLNWETCYRCGCGSQGLQLKIKYDSMYNKGVWTDDTTWILKDYPITTMHTLRKRLTPISFSLPNQALYYHSFIALCCRTVTFKSYQHYNTTEFSSNVMLLYIQTHIFGVHSSYYCDQPKACDSFVDSNEKYRLQSISFLF